MRKIAFLAAVAATLCTVACNKNMDAPVNEVPGEAGNQTEQTLHPLTIKIKGDAETKATSITPSNEVKVNSLQVIAFKNNVKDVYGSITNNDEITIQCADGGRTVWAVVNGPDISAVNTPTELQAVMCTLSDWSLDNFVMTGSTWVELPSTETAEIEVTRMASRIVLKKITRDFTVATEGAKTMTISRIQLGDVVMKNNLGGTYVPSAQTDWEFTKGSWRSGATAFFDNLNVSLSDDDSYETAHTFYVFPNPTVDDSASTTWCPRRTHLIVQVDLDGTTEYYVIPLPVLERNKSYEIDELTLTKHGASNPYTYFQDASFEVSVKAWTVVPVTSGTTI